MLDWLQEFFESFEVREVIAIAIITLGIWVMIFKSPIWAESTYFAAKPYMLWAIAAAIPFMAVVGIKLIKQR